MEEVQLQFLLDVTDKDSNNNNLSLSERMYRHALNTIMRTFQKLQKILLFLEKGKPIVTPSPGDESPTASLCLACGTSYLQYQPAPLQHLPYTGTAFLSRDISCRESLALLYCTLSTPHHCTLSIANFQTRPS